MTTFYYIQIQVLCVEWLRFTVYRYKSCEWSVYVLLYTDISLESGVITCISVSGVLSFTIYRYKSCVWSDYVLLYTDISLVCGVTTFYYIQI